MEDESHSYEKSPDPELVELNRTSRRLSEMISSFTPINRSNFWQENCSRSPVLVTVQTRHGKRSKISWTRGISFTKLE